MFHPDGLSLPEGRVLFVGRLTVTLVRDRKAIRQWSRPIGLALVRIPARHTARDLARELVVGVRASVSVTLARFDDLGPVCEAGPDHRCVTTTHRDVLLGIATRRDLRLLHRAIENTRSVTTPADVELRALKPLALQKLIQFAGSVVVLEDQSMGAHRNCCVVALIFLAQVLRHFAVIHDIDRLEAEPRNELRVCAYHIAIPVNVGILIRGARARQVVDLRFFVAFVPKRPTDLDAAVDRR